MAFLEMGKCKVFMLNLLIMKSYKKKLAHCSFSCLSVNYCLLPFTFKEIYMTFVSISFSSWWEGVVTDKNEKDETTLKVHIPGSH